jgi:hypothetical protein
VISCDQGLEAGFLFSWQIIVFLPGTSFSPRHKSHDYLCLASKIDKDERDERCLAVFMQEEPILSTDQTHDEVDGVCRRLPHAGGPHAIHWCPDALQLSINARVRQLFSFLKAFVIVIPLSLLRRLLSLGLQILWILYYYFLVL